ncbi:MAG: DUF4919 domain-containing protein [Nocardioides sp.]
MSIGTDEPADLAELATAYATARDPEVLTRLRDVVRTSPGYDAGVDVPGLLGPLLARDAYDEIVAEVRSRMPGLFLSPAAHQSLATAYDALGDATRAGRERRTARLAVESILATGDGTRERPWIPLRISDEYDVLRARGRRSRAQELVVRDGRALDRHRCDDGSELWFDVTGMVPVGREAE